MINTNRAGMRGRHGLIVCLLASALLLVYAFPSNAARPSLSDLQQQIGDLLQRVEDLESAGGTPGGEISIPVGTIIIWTGPMEGQHPIIDGGVDTRWVVCNGLNDTPDLMYRFLVGASDWPGSGPFGGGDQYMLDAFGGATSDTVSLRYFHIPQHTHWADFAISGRTEGGGGHSHRYDRLRWSYVSRRKCVSGTITDRHGPAFQTSTDRRWGGCIDDSYTSIYLGRESTTYAQPHQHWVNLSVRGRTDPWPGDLIEQQPIEIDTLPPYRAVIFLMYVGE
jgi:hypothetical protein